MAARKAWQDPRPDKVERLLKHLESGEPIEPTVDLTAVGYVPGWRINKGHGGYKDTARRGYRAIVWYVYSPHAKPKDPTIPWAGRPSTFSGKHGEVVLHLRGQWFTDAVRWVEAQRRAGERHE